MHFFAKKVDDLFLVIARLNIPPNLSHPAKTVLKIDSCCGWGCTSCPLTHFLCKLGLNFFTAHCTPLATPVSCVLVCDCCSLVISWNLTLPSCGGRLTVSKMMWMLSVRNSRRLNDASRNLMRSYATQRTLSLPHQIVLFTSLPVSRSLTTRR